MWKQATGRDVMVVAEKIIDVEERVQWLAFVWRSGDSVWCSLFFSMFEIHLANYMVLKKKTHRSSFVKVNIVTSIFRIFEHEPTIRWQWIYPPSMAQWKLVRHGEPSHDELGFHSDLTINYTLLHHGPWWSKLNYTSPTQFVGVVSNDTKRKNENRTTQVVSTNGNSNKKS